MYIRDLYDICESNENKKVVAIVGDLEVKVTTQYYVENEIVCYYSVENVCGFEKQTTGGIIAKYILEEAEDECWSKCGFEEKNGYGDCSIGFCMGEDTYENTNVYDVIDVKVEDNLIKMYCEVL